MAASVNKVTLLGHLGRDPETRQMQGGGKVVNLSLATSETWKDKRTGEKHSRSEWHRVVIFNEHLAEVAERFLKKGHRVYLEGELRTRKWTDQQGIERYTTEVVIDRFRGELVILNNRLDNRPEGQGHAPPQQPSGSVTSMSDVASTRPKAASSWQNDDDMPF